ncbi:hypothetical protein I4U23_004631 [Adineta vaga]|nr:hypothetical protein I4U23_004631 [Adineta vaga]
MKLERSSGVLLHITSLPSKYGIGDFGSDAFRFIDFLVETKQKLWQILPLTTINCPSPYSSESSFGGNPWLISPEKLIEMNLLSFDELNLLIDSSKFHNDFVNFKDFEGISWNEWPQSLRHHDRLALENIRQNNQNQFEYHLFVQYIFDKQWNELKRYANERKIQIIGDMAMYIDYNSVDVWANSNLFQLDSNTMKPIVVSGFPGDEKYDIQIWNQPIYKWNDETIRNDLFQWWIKRIEKSLSMYDILRLDHFRGFIQHYVIPLDENTSKPITSNAHWMNTPGYELFTAVKKSLGENISIIVEDIGSATTEVFQLRDDFQFYGIRILQMGFYSYPDNMYSPHNYIPNSIAYTGTHDNATTIEWWSNIATREEKDLFMEYIRRPFFSQNESIDGLEKYISWYFIQMVLQSSSNGSIILMQDLLNINVRMNYPGKESSMEKSEPQNWSWRFQWSQLTSNIRSELTRLTQIYGRNLLYGKSIPPKDMIMKDDTSFLHK